ncbi:sensor histidine kinase [Deinococcus alpinitundrae]|uniref:sensor histidine kinase n=1 Tax=Deinococcus alpinitundrae TaxID=468913 RepID=UPI00137AEB99|nr:HAMP domain-containing sensor histidine kinase [Deinococcus alpinitundrae]
MKRPFWRTLAWRFVLACVLVSAVTLGTVGFISAASTRSQFNALLGEQAREDLAGQVQTYVQSNGTLNGFQPSSAKGRGVDGSSRTAPNGKDRGLRSPWLVLNAQHRAVFSTPNVPRGRQVVGQPETPLTFNGTLVGYLVPSGMQARPDGRSEAFLANTYRAIGWAMLGATGLAVLIGLLLSRTLLKPLRELQIGIRALQRGEASNSLRTNRKDEFGDVLEAFDEMHQEIVRNQQARRQLTANIAHDLNTPLSVISGTLEGILDGTFKPTLQRLQRLHHETGHVTQLVNDLRFLSLADAGELQIHPRPTNVAELMTAAMSNFQEVAEQQGVTLYTELPQEELTLVVDQVRITQVLQNLLSNALAHTPTGADVKVGAAWEGNFLCVRVQDTGIGISSEDLPHVFERLYRADKSRSTGGSGLGLSICKSIVEAHGGQIRISSTLGQGTTVTFTMPGSEPENHPGLGPGNHQNVLQST